MKSFIYYLLISETDKRGIGSAFLARLKAVFLPNPLLAPVINAIFVIALSLLMFDLDRFIVRVDTGVLNTQTSLIIA